MPPVALIPVGLVEDDEPYRSYVATLLAATGRFHVVFATARVEDALAALRQTMPRLLLLDLRLPGVTGAEAVERFAASAPELQVLMLTAVDRDDALLDSIRAGASGYLLKGIASTDLVAAVDEALAGGAPMSPSIARRVLGLLRAPPVIPAAKTPPPALPELTAREAQVLQLVADGLSDKEIATQLGTAVSTVKNQLAAVYTKWRVRSRTEAVVRLLQRDVRESD